jgi:3-hydroxy acid dehydrogenase / malonic semialdehyde reductase
MKKTILITGATSGFGKAIATRFAKDGDDLILTGRREALLIELSAKLRTEYKVEVLSFCFDVRVKEEVELAISSLPDEWKDIDVLVNNAGLTA